MDMKESPPVRHCPCCGQGLVMRQRPKVDLPTNTLLYDTWAVHLSPSEAEVLTVLSEQMPAVVSYERLRIGVYGLYDGADHPVDKDSCIETWICHLRAKLKPIGLKIVTHRGRPETNRAAGHPGAFNLTWGTDARAA